MENPATWGRAEQVVNEALRQADQNRREMRMGLSAVRLITDALRREGLLLAERYTPEGRERWRAEIQEAKRTLTKEKFQQWLNQKMIEARP